MSGGAKFGMLVVVVLLVGAGAGLYVNKDRFLNPSVGPDLGSSVEVEPDATAGLDEVPEPHVPAADEIPVPIEPGAYEKEQRAYLAENATKDGIRVTESGLQFKVLSESGGSDKPGPGDIVQFHYRGRLTDGIEFESSYNYGEPAEFPLSEVIAGWSEGLQLMSVGDVYEFTLPPALGYGAEGAGDEIPGHSVLIYEIELLDIIHP